MRSHLKNTLAASMVLLAQTACSNFQTPNDTLVTVLSNPIANLDPLFSTEANAQHVNQLIHLALVRVDKNLLPEPYLAEKFQVVNDHTFEFWLRKGCHFQNGREVNATDIEQSIALYSDPRYKSFFQENFRKITSVEKLDPYHVRIHTKDPAPTLIFDLAVLKILPLEEYSADKFVGHPVGAGPYKVVENSASGLKLQKFDNGCLPSPGAEKIQAKVVRDDLARFLKLRNGEVDIILNDMDYRKVKLVTDGKVPALRAEVTEGTTYSYMGLNLANKDLAKKNVRRAIALSLDIPAIIHYKLVDFATTTSTLIAPSSWYHEDIPPVARDLSAAKKLLDQEGYGNGENGKAPLELTLKTTTYKPIMENARAIAEQLHDAGIIVHHKAYEWGTFYGDVKSRNTEMFLLRWVGVVSPDLLAEIFHSKHLLENNRTNYKSPEMDAILDRASSSADPERRRAAFREAQLLAAEDLPYISLWHNKNTVTYRENLRHVEPLPTGDWDMLSRVEKMPAGAPRSEGK